MHAEPQQEHHWLQKLVGEWTYESQATMPGGSEEVLRGKEIVRSLGGLWVLCEAAGPMPGGGAARWMMTLGYDPAQSCYVGTWIGSMMTHLWAYRGERDATGNVLTLESEGPSFAGDGAMAKYRDVIEFKSDDHRTLTGQALGADGAWSPFVITHFHRQ